MRTNNTKQTKVLTKNIKFPTTQIDYFDLPDRFILIRDKQTKLPLFVTHQSLIVSYGIEHIGKSEFYFINYKPFKF